MFLTRITNRVVRQSNWLLGQKSQNCLSAILCNKNLSTKIAHAERLDDKMLKVTWENKGSCNYPYIFLRDNCLCPKCFHPDSKQRLVDTVKKIDINIKAKNVKHDIHKDEVVVTWPDNHKSIFTGKWLRERKFPESLKDIKPATLYGLEAIPWTSKDLKDKIPTVQYNEMMTDKKALMKHIESLIIYGVSIVKNAPCKEGIFPNIAKRMSDGQTRITHYGETFTVKTKPQPSNLAYTSGYLALHVDLPFYDYQPGVQLLHCIEQSEGENSGVNHLADGFKAAQRLKDRNPDAFRILTQIKFMFNDEGEDSFGKFFKKYERPIISLDNFDNVESISQNNHVRSSFVNAPPEDVIKSYEAYYALVNILYEDDIVLPYKMEPGDILTFNNKRILHGRTSYDTRITNRWLEGIYLDWDEVNSKYRVLRSSDENDC